MVEHRLPKPRVASSNLVVRSIFYAGVAQLAERLIRNQQVRGSTPLASSIIKNMREPHHEGDGAVYFPGVGGLKHDRGSMPMFYSPAYTGRGGMNKMKRWLHSLITCTPQEGFELAIILSQRGVLYTQPSAEIRELLRPVYSTNADSLIAVSQVIAINFQTVAAANNYWRDAYRD